MLWLAWPWAATAGPAKAAQLPPLPKVKDSDGREIGSPANEMERPGNDGPTPNATLPLAPLPEAPRTAVDCGAYWYNDFGLEWTRRNHTKSWMGWYDWRWNWRSTNGFTGKNPAGQGYFPDRHPTLGWYRGDDRNTLSWQVKWLVEHGCTWGVIQQRALMPDDDGRWSDPASLAHWCWQLTMNLPAVSAGLFKLCFWLPHGAGPTAAEQGPSAARWRAGQAVGKGQTVRHGPKGQVFRALRDGATTTPDTAPADWAPAGGGASASAGQWNAGVAYAAGTSVINAAGDQRLYRALVDNTGQQPDRFSAGDKPSWELVPMPQAWQQFAKFYGAQASKIKTVRHGDKTYATVFMWEAEMCRALWGDGSFQHWLQELGQAMAAAHPGWDGVAVLMRNAPAAGLYRGRRGSGSLNYDQALSNGALLLRTSYPGTDLSRGANPGPDGYQSLVDSFRPGSLKGAGVDTMDRHLHCVPTAISSLQPHGSTANYRGHSPARFEAFVRKARQASEAGSGYRADDGRPLLLVYNIAEWAEGGPGLQPNQQDGFGYLNSLKRAISD